MAEEASSSRIFRGELVSLVMQFVASFCWVIGALLEGPTTTADFYYLFAAVAWSLSNFASAWSMWLSRATGKDAKATEQVQLGAL